MLQAYLLPLVHPTTRNPLTSSFSFFPRHRAFFPAQSLSNFGAETAFWPPLDARPRPVIANRLTRCFEKQCSSTPPCPRSPPAASLVTLPFSSPLVRRWNGKGPQRGYTDNCYNVLLPASPSGPAAQTVARTHCPRTALVHSPALTPFRPCQWGPGWPAPKTYCRNTCSPPGASLCQRIGSLSYPRPCRRPRDIWHE